MLKGCCWCQAVLPITDFRVDTGRKDKRMRRCKLCDNIYRACKRAIRPRIRPNRKGMRYEGAITPIVLVDSVWVRGEKWNGTESAYMWAKRLCSGTGWNWWDK